MCLQAFAWVIDTLNKAFINPIRSPTPMHVDIHFSNYQIIFHCVRPRVVIDLRWTLNDPMY